MPRQLRNLYLNTLKMLFFCHGNVFVLSEYFAILRSLGRNERSRREGAVLKSMGQKTGHGKCVSLLCARSSTKKQGVNLTNTQE